MTRHLHVHRLRPEDLRVQGFVDGYSSVSARYFGEESYRDRRKPNATASTQTTGHAVTLIRPQPDTTVCTRTGKMDMDTTPVSKNVLAEARGDDNAILR